LRAAPVAHTPLPVIPANTLPSGGTVAQGAASFNTSGSQLTVTTSANTLINWQSFNIGSAATTTFVEPSATSVVWNQINGGSLSQILGTLNANGYVVLQNQSGFVVGGTATITAHGLVMTTAPTHAPNLSSGDAWTFNAPPPTASIINYGQINIAGGGSAYLIASDIENNGAISAPGGKIGLYAGQQVLVSTSPNGSGLSARVTLPQGSVDNDGNLIADGGSIMAQAQTVNQNGLIQANSVLNVNGVIELVANDRLTLGAHSDIEANGDATGVQPSPGGFVVLQSGNTYADTRTAKINVAGQNGGPDGVVEVMGNNLKDATSVQAQIDGLSAAQFGAQVKNGVQDILLINPWDLTLWSDTTDTSNPGPNPNTTSPNLNVADLAGYSQIDLRALDNIELSVPWTLAGAPAPASVSLVAGNNLTVDADAGIVAGNNWGVKLTAANNIYFNSTAPVHTQNGNINVTATTGNLELSALWTLTDATAPASVNLSAGNSILFDGGPTIAGLAAGNDWNVNLTAGAALPAGSLPAAGNDGVYLNHGAYLQTQNGNINVWAARDVIIQDSTVDPDTGLILTPSGAMRTLDGGSINVTAEYGDVNAGNSIYGYTFGLISTTYPYYYSVNSANLGGISTAAGGNVTLTAGGNVISYLPLLMAARVPSVQNPATSPSRPGEPFPGIMWWPTALASSGPGATWGCRSPTRTTRASPLVSSREAGVFTPPTFFWTMSSIPTASLMTVPVPVLEVPVVAVGRCPQGRRRRRGRMFSIMIRKPHYCWMPPRPWKSRAPPCLCCLLLTRPVCSSPSCFRPR
jgi:filamentous hemagglutinin family protein